MRQAPAELHPAISHADLVIVYALPARVTRSKYMSLTSLWCCALQRSVTRVTNVGGEVVAVICPEVEEATGVCRLKTSALRDGVLADLLRQGDETLAEKPPPRCTIA